MPEDDLRVGRIDFGSGDVAGNHFLRVVEIVAVMRAVLAERQDERRRVFAPPGASCALGIIGWSRGDVAQEHIGQRTDVDPHLEGRGTAQGIDLLFFEFVLISAQDLAIQLRCVLAHFQPIEGQAPVERCIGVFGNVYRRIDRLQSLGAAVRADVPDGERIVLLASGAFIDRATGLDHQICGFDRIALLVLCKAALVSEEPVHNPVAQGIVLTENFGQVFPHAVREED